MTVDDALNLVLDELKKLRRNNDEAKALETRRAQELKFRNAAKFETLLREAKSSFGSMLKNSAKFKNLISEILKTHPHYGCIMLETCYDSYDTAFYGLGITKDMQLVFGCLYYYNMDLRMEDVNISPEFYDELCSVLDILRDPEKTVRFFLQDLPNIQKKMCFQDFPKKGEENRIPLE